MQTLTENLHDKWSASNWHQLWADDSRAFVLLNEETGYSVVVDDGETVNMYEIGDFSPAIDEWNSQINEYLAEVR